MKKALIWTGSVIGVGAVLALLFGWIDRPDAPRVISVDGQCLATAPKDRTAITLRVTTLDKSAATSMKMATAKIAEITNFLKNQDVQMQTTEFNSYERSEWNRELEKSVVLGTETTIAVEVSATSIETIEKILTQFAGQTDVYSENLRMYTSAEAMKPVLEDCLATAVENARERANALAAGDGRTAGKMLSVSYNAGTSSSIQPRASNFLTASAKMAVADAEAFSAAGSIVAKDTEVSVNVSATFEIK
ncbi:MAG TPA: SIMPL domain-containing protein [Candidatus Enterousia intestinigallinarum]|uniref:SIMPL domain-containing protein n=1 Tax=Candidatus Enterousia intestinigallinarum TaxID=2840790 RepID=A0A9D1FFR5_9PROT|nr:SIMPL domain-containing protein [Candidatus Enterousia intestinigallinarum]